jgi:hypothetical protein
MPPSYDGSGLVNLVAELERRLIGSSPSPGLSDPSVVPEADGYVLLLFDGLGHRQLDVAPARDLATAERAVLAAGFPTTTTTSLATVATGLAPAGHGVIGHILHLPGVADTVNVLKWVTPSGRPVQIDHGAMLPSPTSWERLAAAGIEPVTIQPGAFSGSPLSRMLYRGCRFEPVWTVDELVAATVDLARPGRLVVAYHAAVDVSAHLHGQGSDQYREAVAQAAWIWTAVAARLRPDVGLVGTSDHGHVDYGPADKLLIRDTAYDALRMYGDPRSLYVSGDPELVLSLASATGAEVRDRSQLRELLGPGDHPRLDERLPDRLLLAPPGRLLLARPFDKRLIGYHGGLEPAEIEIPLLVR